MELLALRIERDGWRRQPAKVHARLLVAVVFGLASATMSWAERLPRDVVGSGATVATGTGVRLSGTVGQPVVGISAGSARRVLQGFWPTGDAGPAAVDPALDPQTRPSRFELGPPSPNPAAGRVAFAIALPRASRVELLVTDVQGRLALRVDGGWMTAGRHTLAVEGGNALQASGVWFAHLRVDGRECATRWFARLR
jgi:hypothetical protein